jgi:hypothetical protein
MVIGNLGGVADQSLVELYDVRVFLAELITGPITANYDIFWHKGFIRKTSRPYLNERVRLGAF